MTNLQQTVNQAIPIYFNEEDFNEFILPYLWVGVLPHGCRYQSKVEIRV